MRAARMKAATSQRALDYRLPMRVWCCTRSMRSTTGNPLLGKLRKRIRAVAAVATGHGRARVRSQRLVTSSGYGDGRVKHRSLRRPRPRILHRAGLRGRTHLRGERRKGKSRALRLRRGRRTLRRPRRALSRRAGAGDGIFDRRFAPHGGAAASRQDRHRRPKPGRWSSPCSTRRASPTTRRW